MGLITLVLLTVIISAAFVVGQVDPGYQYDPAIFDHKSNKDTVALTSEDTPQQFLGSFYGFIHDATAQIADFLSFAEYTLLTYLTASPAQAKNSKATVKCSGDKQRDYYVAAVVEYEGSRDTKGLTPEQILLRNTGDLIRIIREAAAETTDVLVFAEYGLTSMESSLTQAQRIQDKGENPCSSTTSISEIIRNISCAARSARIYVVIDILELVPHGSPGTPERDMIYNTAVAFDRDGNIAAKYRKINLAPSEVEELDAPEVPEIVSFKTDFGVEFGMFICFDILFDTPARQLLEKGIKHFVFPTAWIDELPYLTAIQSHTFWSSSAEAVLLVSGYHHPRRGALGSGIYTPSGQPLNYTFDPTSGTKVIYARVPKDPLNSLPAGGREGVVNEWKSKVRVGKPDTGRLYYRQDLSKNFTIVPISLNNVGVEHVFACHDDFCCHFNYSYVTVRGGGNRTVNHRLVVSNTRRSYPKPVEKTTHLQICSVVRCLNTSVDSCTTNAYNLVDADVPRRFKSFQLQAVSLNPMELFSPGFTTLDANMDLIPIELFERTLSVDKRAFTVSSNLLQNVDLQTVAIYHRAS